MKFKLTSKFTPAGDQPQAIVKLTKGVEEKKEHQVLLGVTGSGKSVVRETTVLVRDAHHKVSEVNIGHFIDNLFIIFKNKLLRNQDSEILRTEDLPLGYHYETFSFNAKSKESSWKQIREFTRHVSPKKLYKVVTSIGREITVTGDHNFFVLQHGKFDLKATKSLDKNSYVPLPRKINEPDYPLTSLFLSRYIDDMKGFYIDAPNFAKMFISNKIEYVHVLKNRQYGLARGERISLSHYSELIKISPKLELNAKIGVKAKNFNSPLHFPITKNFLKFLGYYIAEGHGEKKFFILSSASEEIIRTFTSVIKNELKVNIKYIQGTYDYRISSSFWSYFLIKWCGNVAKSKQLPPFWPELSNLQLGSILSAYFSADGTIDVKRKVVSATTASHKLASQILYALLRFGIIGRFRKRLIKLPNKNTRNLYFEINISGKKDLRLFLDNIGFTLHQKQIKLEKIIQGKYNTNIDIVPIDGNQIKKLRLCLGLFQRDISSFAGIARSLITLIEGNLRKPSQTVYLKILEALKKRAKETKKLDILVELTELYSLSYLYWTPIKTIEQIEGNGKVYDFSVEENETFLAGDGGLFVHNTFTMSQVIQNVQKPTLVIAHNKTLAGQLYQEFREFFPENSVNYFVSYYDYYQPEAYVPSSDTYIEKEAEINEEIDKLRLSATANLLTRKDVIVVASVSCIYNLGSPVEYGKFVLEMAKGMKIEQRDILLRLTDLQYERNEYGFQRGSFRVRGESIDVFPAYMDSGLRIDMNSGKVSGLFTFSPLTGETVEVLKNTTVYPAKHYMTDPETYKDVFPQIRSDADKRVQELKSMGKLVEAQRIGQRTNYDLEMIQEIGYVNGIENYSRYFDGRKPGQPPYTLIDYMQACSKDWLLMVDESHITLPQIRGMYNGDRARKETLIEYGFRLPSALDNRPLKFEEFMARVNQAIYVSATPDEYELSLAGEDNVAEQLIRPTGIVDPTVSVKPTNGQIDDLIQEIQKRVEKKQRVLVTTLTKRMAEELSEYLEERNIKVAYLHSDIETINRQDILDNLRKGQYDVLVGINLLREGIDLPEVTLVAILDADKEGFLRSKTSLIQTMGRAARNIDSEVILYADTKTRSINEAIREVERRREVQLAYNIKHHITPKTIEKAIRERLYEEEEEEQTGRNRPIDVVLELADKDVLLPDEREKVIQRLRLEMKNAAKNLDFETAALLRDRIKSLQKT